MRSIRLSKLQTHIEVLQHVCVRLNCSKFGATKYFEIWDFKSKLIRTHSLLPFFLSLSLLKRFETYVSIALSLSRAIKENVSRMEVIFQWYLQFFFALFWFEFERKWNYEILALLMRIALDIGPKKNSAFVFGCFFSLSRLFRLVDSYVHSFFRSFARWYRCYPRTLFCLK